MNLQNENKTLDKDGCSLLATAVIKSAVIAGDVYFLDSEYSQLFRDLCNTDLKFITSEQAIHIKEKKEKEKRERRIKKEGVK